MSQSGAILKEVGTTNKTHLVDYENAVNENTAALMKVHTSNYKICGFTKEIDNQELVGLGRKLGLSVIEDLGSGVLIDLSKYGLPYEPTVQNSIKSGMDVVTFSGDKMLGGPQAGIIVGNKSLINQMKKNPLTRAFRIDKLTLTALEGTLRLYLDEEEAINNIPILRMLCYSQQDINKRAKRLYSKLKKSIGQCGSLKIEDEFSEVGGGSMPMHRLPTKVIAIQLNDISVDKLDKALRQYKTPIIARISKERLLLDIRTIIDDEFDIIDNAFVWVIKGLIECNTEKGEGCS
jgi:L-seryl-tRNA(Ser) seleniumtransferase